VRHRVRECLVYRQLTDPVHARQDCIDISARLARRAAPLHRRGRIDMFIGTTARLIGWRRGRIIG
jgi:predicted nucleic acid-binding protein